MSFLVATRSSDLLLCCVSKQWQPPAPSGCVLRWRGVGVVSVGEREKRVPLLRHAHAYKIPVTMPRHYKLSLIDPSHWRFCSFVTARTGLQNTGNHASALRAVTNRYDSPATLFSCYSKHTLTKYRSPCLGITSCH